MEKEAPFPRLTRKQRDAFGHHVLVDHTHTAPVADPQATYASSGLMQGTAFAPAVLKDGDSRVWTVSNVTVSTTLTQLSLPAETRYRSLTGETHTELT